MSQKKITIFGRNGETEPHTKANARDLVANCNGYWSWNKQSKSTPMDAPPFITLTPPSNKPQSHEILERMGTGSVRDVQEIKAIEPDEPDAVEPDEGEAGVVVVDDPAPAVEEPVVDAVPELATETPSESKSRARRKRFEE